MAKYSFELKKQVVSDYLNGKGGYRYLAKKYGISDNKIIRTWVAVYKTHGDNGLLRSRKKENYSFDYKLRVVELYLSTEVSYKELALSEGINNPALITKWVNDFRIAGPDALRPKKKGRRKSLETSKSEHKSIPENTLDEVTSINTSSEHVKQLEEEVLKLRIENAYLKELRRLRLEEEALLKKQRELSTASEETLN